MNGQEPRSSLMDLFRSLSPLNQNPFSSILLKLTIFVLPFAAIYFIVNFFQQDKPVDEYFEEKILGGTVEVDRAAQSEYDHTEGSKAFSTVGMGGGFSQHRNEATETISNEPKPIIFSSEPTLEKKPKTVRLSSLDYLNVQIATKQQEPLSALNVFLNGWSKEEPFSINGSTFSEGIAFSIGYGQWNNQTTVVAHYELNEQFASLKGEVGIDDKSVDSYGFYRLNFLKRNEDNSVSVLGSSNTFTLGQSSQDFHINVEGVKGLLIELVKLDTTDEEVHIAIVNTKLK